MRLAASCFTFQLEENPALTPPCIVALPSSSVHTLSFPALSSWVSHGQPGLHWLSPQSRSMLVPTWQAGSLSPEIRWHNLLSYNQNLEFREVGPGLFLFQVFPGLWGSCLSPESLEKREKWRNCPRSHSSICPSIYCVLRTEKRAESKVARNLLLPGFQTWAIPLRWKVTCFFFPQFGFNFELVSFNTLDVCVCEW